MVLCDQHDEWAAGGRYMSAELLPKPRVEVLEGEATTEAGE
jgi:hypothetical protein